MDSEKDNSIDEEQRRKEISAIVEQLQPYVAVVAVVPRADARAEEIIRGEGGSYTGTISFVDTGTERLLITCSHVYKLLAKAQENHPDATLVLVGKTDALDLGAATLIERHDSSPDIAILKYPDPDEIIKIGKAYFPAEEWPPRRAAVGDNLVCVGYPGQYTEGHDNSIILRASVFSDKLTSVSDRGITIADENSSRRLVQLNPALSPLESFGGMSGSAAYVLSDSSPQFRLVGFFYETGMSNFFPIQSELLSFSHAAFIKADGHIDHQAFPPV